MATPTGTTHRCPGIGCQVMVSRNQLACRTHWFKVSARTRSWVWRAYKAGSDDHSDAIVQAMSEMNR